MRMRLKMIICAAFMGFVPILVGAKSYIISPIPPPSETILDISDKECNEGCLKRLYNRKMFFSFLAKFNPKTTDKKLLPYYTDALAQINSIDNKNNSIGGKKSPYFKIALLIPKQILGQYSATLSNTILAYLMAKNIDFEFEVFNCINENPDNINITYSKITQSNPHFIIAILTHQGAQSLISSANIVYPTYLPTINKERIEGENPPRNLYFGGISYKKQIELLYSLAKNSNVVEYNDEGQIGVYLSSLLDDYDFNITQIRTVSNQDASHFSAQLKADEHLLQGATLFLNTSASKSGLILSQLGYFNKEPKRFLSTQINFSLTLLQLAPPQNRKNFFVVSSIGKINPQLIEYASLLNSDLKYDWVSYSTALGVELGLEIEKINKGRYFREAIKSSQVEYQNFLYTTRGYSFVPIKP